MELTKTGIFECPKKSAYSIEYYDSSWEFEYMQELESDPNISKWTKNHGLRIAYYTEDNKHKTYEPDFLVEKTNKTIELVEMKGTHLLKNPNTKRKSEYAKKWCADRGIKYRLISKYQ